MTEGERRLSVVLKPPTHVGFLAVAFLVLLLPAAFILWLNMEYARADQLRNDAAASFERRTGQIALLSSLKDAETAQRGYLLTGSPAFLAPYEPARRDIDHRLDLLEAAGPGTFPSTYVPSLRRIARAKMTELDRTIALRRAGRTEAALQAVREGRGKRLMDALRTSIERMIVLEDARSTAQISAFLAARRMVRTTVFTAIVVFAVSLCLFLVELWRLSRQRHASIVETFEAAERHSTILDSTIDAILILNPSGTVETMNASATRMLGYLPTELERRDVSTILDIAPGDGSFHKRLGLVNGALTRPLMPDRIIRDRQGRELPVDIAMGVMHVPSGAHIVVSLRDISERKRIERIKDDLMSTVSHELRSPLTSIVGSLGLLRAGAAGGMSDQATRLVEIAENNSRRLIRLINDMLDIDRIESGKLRLARVTTDLRDVTGQACLGSEGIARARNVRIQCHEAGEPVIVSGDADRLVQVVTNLLSNAVRVSSQGGTVDVRLSIEGGRAIVRVEDRGPGVPEGFRDRIFGRFERMERDNAASGTGLGLAISREIVVRHDGQIDFEDRAGGGTSFIVSLPLLCAVAVEAGQDSPTVLICEADDVLASSLVAIVTMEGLAFERARSADEARAALARRDYAALLVGLKLPGEGGVAFAQSVQNGDPQSRMPVIVVAEPAIGENGHTPAMDVVAWIRKPADMEQLSVALRTALSRSDARQPVILHLDDDPDLLEVVAAAIEPEARIVAATDLPSARAILQNLSPDVAILDMMLADGSGLELIPFLVDKDGLAIPTIIYTAQDVSGDLANSVDAVIIKAASSIPDLKATIRRVVRSREARP